MSAQIIQFKRTQESAADTQQHKNNCELCIPSFLWNIGSYSLKFLAQLLFWVFIGGILSLIFPTWVVFTGLIAVQFVAGWNQQKG
jgi:hypothetical protein